LNRILYILLTLVSVSGLYAQDTLCPGSDSVRYYVSGPQGMIYHWNVNGGTFAVNTDTLSSTVYIKWSQAAGNYSLSVYGDLNGCFSETGNLVVNIRDNPPVNLGPDVELCEGEKVTFEIGNGYDSITWSDHTIGKHKEIGLSDTLWVSAYNINKCISYDTVIVKVLPKPFVNLGNDTDLCGDAHKILDAGNNNASYQWFSDDGSINGYVTQTIDIGLGMKKIWVVVTDTSNTLECQSSDTINILACTKVFDHKKVPNVFTPGDNDPANNEWIIDGLSDFPKAIVEVYDMWGRMVYRSRPGYPKNWDGKTGSDYAPMGTYYYLIYLNNKKKDVYLGSISIIR
jgi:gliding motility-associated-like protein